MLENYKTALMNMYYLKAIGSSIRASLISSLIVFVIALVCAYYISKLDEKIQDSIITILNMRSNYIGVPLAFKYILLLGNTGMFILLFKYFGLNELSNFNIYLWIGLIITYVCFQIPLAIITLYSPFLSINKEVRQAAMLLGANSFQFWAKIGIPVLFPSIVGTLSILFVSAIGSYATAYALAGRSKGIVIVRIGSLVVILGVAMVSMMINEKLSKYKSTKIRVE